MVRIIVPSVRVVPVWPTTVVAAQANVVGSGFALIMIGVRSISVTSPLNCVAHLIVVSEAVCDVTVRAPVIHSCADVTGNTATEHPCTGHGTNFTSLSSAS